MRGRPFPSTILPSTTEHQLTIPATLAGHRLDQALSDLLPEYSRTRIKDWIESGLVQVDGRVLPPKERLIGGEQVRLVAQTQAQVPMAPQRIALNVLHKDRHLFIVDKPAGLVVHPGAGNLNGTLQNALLHLDPKLADLPRAGIVHRLDKGTSGLLAVARTVAAHTELTRMIAEREVERHYEAVCAGVMTAGGTVDAPIDRHPKDRVRMAVRGSGRDAVTHYRVLQRFRAHTHVRVKLETGRTHQIRVHLAHVGYPIVGDTVYGGRLRLPKGASAQLIQQLQSFARPALHAAELALAHPISGKRVECKAPLPKDLQQLLKTLGADTGQ
jgi:23S rRNA pseudouridine1911/1915/1917 synthase